MLRNFLKFELPNNAESKTKIDFEPETIQSDGTGSTALASTISQQYGVDILPNDGQTIKKKKRLNIHWGKAGSHLVLK